jgi:NADH-quinone oxidoreductase subunit L
MGGLKNKLPVTFWTFLAGVLAISGIPLFSGFFSKDEILWKSFSNPQGSFILWLMGFITAGMTAFYMFRLFLSVFLGKSRVEEKVKPHIHESPKSMTIPLIVLAVLSIIGGYVGIPHSLGGGNSFESFLSVVFKGAEEAHIAHASYSAEYLLMILSIAVIIVGILIAYRFYITHPDLPKKLSQKYKGAYTILLNKYYVDELYAKTIVNPLLSLALWCWRFFDAKIIDGAANGSAFLTGWISAVIRKLQTGYVRNYALSLVLGVVIILAYFMLK